jgi:hypothetical protein
MEEAAEIQALIAAVVESSGSSARSCYDRYKAIVSILCSLNVEADRMKDQASYRLVCAAAAALLLLTTCLLDRCS